MAASPLPAEPAAPTLRKLDIILHDTHIGIWQDDARDPSYRAEIFGPLIRQLRDRGWTIGPDPRCHWPTLRHHHRVGKRGDLRMEISCSGRAIELKFWAVTWARDNPNGPRYDFGKRKRMSFLDRLRVDLETRRILAWLAGRADLTIERRGLNPGLDDDGLTAIAYIEKRYAESWHKDKVLGRPVCDSPSNRRSADGGEVEHGATVWFVGDKGRICRGTALYNLNSMWWVVTGRWGLHNKSCHEIFVRQPEDLRRKRNERQRRVRLEGELSRAIQTMRFPRAETLRKVLFGQSLTYGIWAKDHGAYYRPDYSGYTTDSIAAGRYTWDEAADEVRRVPNELQLVTPDGKRLSASDLGMARAA